MENQTLNKIHELLQQKQDIEKQLQELYKESYKKYENQKDLVRDDNPYSRLFALKKMGIVENFEEIVDKTIIIVGVGGVGSVLAEMLVRCGIGKLILYDYDTVELANMNRLFYTPDQVGLTKVNAAKLTLLKINDNVIIEDFHCNITENDNYKKFLENISSGGINGQNVDLVISCVDNYSARMTINKACNQFQQTWFESGVSEDALSCHFQIMIPGETACFACIPPLAFVEDAEKNIKREGVCAASLPTTMSITAGFLAHTALKYLLEFEDISYYLQYNARNEFFQTNMFEPNPQCLDISCIENQQKLKESQKSFIKSRKLKIQEKKKKYQIPKEDFSEWGIEIVEDSEQQKEEFVDSKQVQEMSIEQLAEQMKNLSG